MSDHDDRSREIHELNRINDNRSYEIRETHIELDRRSREIHEINKSTDIKNRNAKEQEKNREFQRSEREISQEKLKSKKSLNKPNSPSNNTGISTSSNRQNGDYSYSKQDYRHTTDKSILALLGAAFIFVLELLPIMMIILIIIYFSM